MMRHEKMGKKSIAFHLVFRAKDHTLNHKEVDDCMSKILKILNEKFSAEIRNS